MTTYDKGITGSRDFVSVKKFGVIGDGGVNDTVKLKLALESGTKFLLIPAGDYLVDAIDATLTSSVTIFAYGARFVNTSQVATSGSPILRIRGSSSYDVAILGLTIQGPRLTSSTTVGTGVYASTGYPSGIDIYTARKVEVVDCNISGTYYAGIEAHYCAEFHASKNTVFNHGYAGILFSDTVYSNVFENVVDDVGSTMVTDGYGITSATSYNSPSAGYNTTVIITNNLVTRSKRKGVDCHSGLDILISGNTVKGFGNSGYYAVCEGVDKQVRSVRITDNQCEGDTVFVATSSSAAFELGTFGAVLTQYTSFTIEGNEVYNVNCPYAVSCNNGTTTNDVIQFKVFGNTVRDSTFQYGVGLANNTPAIYKAVDVSGNEFINCALTVGYMLLQKYGELRVVGNSLSNCTGSVFISLDDYTKAIVERNTSNGVLLGAAQLEQYSTGLLVETTLTFGGAVSNLDLLKCDLGAANDSTVAVEVSVTETRNNTVGAATYSYIAYATRTGAGAPAVTPAAATNMTLGTLVYGAVTAPQLIWNVASNVITLQLQPKDTFSAVIVRARAISWRGTLTSLVR